MRRASPSIIVVVWLLLGTLPTLPAAGAMFSSVVVFGDSLSDTGNVDRATFGLLPGAGSFDGRFSDGPLWVEHLADELSLARPTESRGGGRNYAHGGATSQNGTSNFFVVRNLGRQVDDYLGSTTPAGSELFVVWIGGNDLLNGSPDFTSPVSRLLAQLDRLYSAGARNFLVPNLPPLGEVPDQRNTAQRAALNANAAGFNTQLAISLDLFDDRPGVALTLVDVAALFHAILANPAAYGFTNTTGTIVGAPAGTDTAGYLFWDGVHPGANAHALLGRAAWRTAIVIPEPVGMMFILVVAGGRIRPAAPRGSPAAGAAMRGTRPPAPRRSPGGRPRA